MIIVYDGSIYEGDPVDAPPRGVQGIIYKDPATDGMNVGVLCLRGWDYYFLEDGSWVGINGDTDFIDHVLFCRPQKVLKGSMLPRDRWQSALKVMEGLLKDKSAIARSFETPDVYVPKGT